MASHQDFVEYLCTQIQDAGTVTYKKMFGEYGIYVNGKIVALICDDQLYVKPTEPGRAQLREVVESPPYEGAKPYFLVENVEDKSSLTRLILATYDALPEPKSKIPKKKAPQGQALKSLPNIGAKLQEQLYAVGIDTPQALKEWGSKAAWLKIKRMDPSACLMRLSALEGAIQGVRWHDLDHATKEDLRAFYHEHKGDSV